MWTKGQLQDLLRKAEIQLQHKLTLVCNLIEKEVYCRRVPFNKINL